MSGKGRSTLFTVGTLLRRAEDQGTYVRVLVQGAWLEGVPVGSDSMGVILDSPHGQSLVRTELVAAVQFDRRAMEDPSTGVPEERTVHVQPAGKRAARSEQASSIPS